jgi:hypothetical protein
LAIPSVRFSTVRLQTPIKKELTIKSYYYKPIKNYKNLKQKHKNFKQNIIINKRYVKILELFLEQEIGIAAMKDILNLRHETIKERIIEVFEIVRDVYKSRK